MNFCSSPAHPSLPSQAPAGEGSRSRPAGRGVCSPGCRHSLPPSLFGSWQGGCMGFPLPFLFLVELPFQAVTPCYPRKPTGIQRFCQCFGTFLAAGYRDSAVSGKVLSLLRPTWAPEWLQGWVQLPQSLSGPLHLLSVWSWQQLQLLPASDFSLACVVQSSHGSPCPTPHPIGRGWCSSCSLARAEGWLGQQQAGQRCNTLCLVSSGTKMPQLQEPSSSCLAGLPNAGVRPPHLPPVSALV